MADIEYRTVQLFDFLTWCSYIQNIRGNGTWTTTDRSISITSVNDTDAYTRPQSATDAAYRISVEPNTTYTVSAILSNTADILFIENGEFISSNYHKTGTWTTKSTTTFLTFRCGVKSSEPLGTTATISDIMLVKGAQPMPWQPYSATGWYHSLKKFDGTNWIDATVKEYDGTIWQ